MEIFTLFFKAVRAGTPTGKKVQPVIDAGKLVPDELMIEVNILVYIFFILNSSFVR